MMEGMGGRERGWGGRLAIEEGAAVGVAVGKLDRHDVALQRGKGERLAAAKHARVGGGVREGGNATNRGLVEELDRDANVGRHGRGRELQLPLASKREQGRREACRDAGSDCEVAVVKLRKKGGLRREGQTRLSNGEAVRVVLLGTAAGVSVNH